jgi:hypothetical protein
MDAVKNFSKGELASGYDASAVSVNLVTGQGAKFLDPATSGSYNAVWWNVTDYFDPADDPLVEIVRVTGRTSDALTIQRGQETTSASAKNISGKRYFIQQGATAKTITDIIAAINAKQNAMGADDNYVTDSEKANLHAPHSDDQIIPDQLSDLAEDSTHRTVTDVEKGEWNGKADPYHNHQAGIVGSPIVTEGTSGNAGKIQMGAIVAWFFDDSTKVAMSAHTIAESAYLTPTDDVTGYICADKVTDGWVILDSADSIDYLQYIPCLIVFKRAGSNSLHTQMIDLQFRGEIEAHHNRVIRCAKYDREPGALESISVDASLNITGSGGYVWASNHRYSILAITTATRQFQCEIINGVWAVNPASHTSPVINNAQYNAVAGLQTLDTGKFTINYIYRGIEDQDHLYTVMGTQEYDTAELAQADNSLPATPNLISSHAMFIGRVIVGKNLTTGFVIESAFKTIFAASTAVTDHGSLSGLADDDHTQYLTSARGVVIGRKVAGKELSSDVTIALDDLSDAEITTPAVDQVLKFNGSKWINGVMGVSGGAGIVYYLVVTDSDITNYDTFSVIPSVDAEVYEQISVAVSDGEKLVKSYASPALGKTLIDAGIWECMTYTSTDAAGVTATTEIMMKVYKRTTGGSETLLFECMCGEINTLVAGLIQCEQVQPDFSINATDRLVIKYYATTTSVAAVDVKLYLQGLTNFSHVHTPLSVLHNDLGGIQGGTTSERYHLTGTELSKLQGVETGADVTDAGNVGGAIAGADAVTTIADADKVGITVGGVLKTLSWTYVKSILKTYFDGLYPSGSGTSTGSNTGDQTLPVKNTGAEINTGTDDAKFATAKSIADSSIVLSAKVQTLTGKRITQRVVTTTDDSTAVIDVDVTDVYELTAVANATTFSTTGTPTDGQKILLRFKDAGVAKGLTWDAIFVIIGVVLPTTTVAGKWHYVLIQYNTAAVKWHAVAVSVQA